jgi:hypothetical protein
METPPNKRKVAGKAESDAAKWERLKLQLPPKRGTQSLPNSNPDCDDSLHSNFTESMDDATLKRLSSRIKEAEEFIKFKKFLLKVNLTDLDTFPDQSISTFAVVNYVMFISEEKTKQVIPGVHCKDLSASSINTAVSMISQLHVTRGHADAYSVSKEGVRSGNPRYEAKVLTYIKQRMKKADALHPNLSATAFSMNMLMELSDHVIDSGSLVLFRTLVFINLSFWLFLRSEGTRSF